MMAFAPHTNDDVRNQLRAGQVPSPDPILLGSAFHAETGVLFEFAERRWPDDDFAPGMFMQVYTVGGPRLAKVMKTVAYVVVDEDENGPVIEKWPLKQTRFYDTEWVRP
jgi:hypothetical protein